MRRNRRSFLLLTMLLAALWGASAWPAFAAVGGGYTACGLTGEYFSNASLTSPSIFVRQDNRLSFDWGTNAPVGGSNTPAFRTFPHDGFSVRWTGQLVPRFSEQYTFTADANAGVRVWLDNVEIIDHWAFDGQLASSAPTSMTAGTTHDIVVEYRHDSGAAKMVLEWSSPSTPQEVIDPVSVSGFNLTLCQSALFADDMKYCMGDDAGEADFFYVPNGGSGAAALPVASLDSNLWPTTDAAIRNNDYIVNTTYEMQFSGMATVTCSLRWFGGTGHFNVGGTSYTTLPSGVGYDPATNLTTALVTPPSYAAGVTTYVINFTNTQRTAASPLHSGITNLHIMRPQSKKPGAPICAQGTIVYPGVKPALQNYTVLRDFSAAFVDERTWSERTLAAMPNAFTSPPNRSNSTSGKPCWEYLIMLANELGKDLYLSISPQADHDYYTQLANLVKYGSDGVTPYTSTSQWPADGPAFPPLNPNLRFYIEYSNEVWNFGFSQYGMAVQDSKDAVTNGTADGLIVNYDGNGSGNFQRWQALQTVNISNAFRAVTGDAAMGNRIRVLLFDQYGGYGKTLGQFIDSYFNKTDPASTYAGTPHPVSYYIWGGGGAIYYGSDHEQGIDPDVQLSNGSFEVPALNPGDRPVDPAGSSWNFTGNAGIYHNVARTQAISDQSLGTTITPSAGIWVGFKFTVGASPIYVYDVGRMVAPGNSVVHPMQIYKTDGSSFLSASDSQVVTAGAPSGQYVWKRVCEAGWTRNPLVPLQLAANTSYYVMSYESADAYYGLTPVTASPGITINCGATAPGNQYGTSSAIVDGSTPNTAYGPTNFTFVTSAVGNLGYPCDAPDGVQAAFIGDTGGMSQTVNFTKTGNFALLFNAAASGSNGANSVNIYVDGAKRTPLGGDNPLWQVSTTPWAPGGFERRSDDLAILWGSTVFPIYTTGTHTIQFTGTGTAGKYIFFDNIQIVSESALFGPDCSHFPSMGQANGQNPLGGLNAFVNTLHGENDWAASWGLKTMAYEGGWSVGGDFDQKPFHSYCKYVSPLSIEANAKAVNVYTRGGGSMFCYYYNQWPNGDDDNATSYSLVKSVIQFNNGLPAEASWGTLTPADLTAANSTLFASSHADSAGNLSAVGAWVSWTIIAPVTGTYQLTSTATGAGGAYVVLADDATTVAAGSTGADLTGTVFLTKGQHSVKARSTASAAMSVKQIAVNFAGGPGTPTLNWANFTSGSCVLGWSGAARAAGYTVYYGTASGNYTFSMDVGNTTSATLTGLDPLGVYYAVVQAYDANRLLGGVSNELRFAQRSIDPEAYIDFEDQTVASTGYNEFDIKNFRFTAVGNSHQMRIEGPTTGKAYPRGWISKVLMTTTWGTAQKIQRMDLGSFDLYSMDLCTTYGNMSVIVTAFDPSGASFEKIVNTPTIASGQCVVIPLVLDWMRITEVDVRWCNEPDGASTQDHCGAIDNLWINRAVLPAPAPVFTPVGGTYTTTQTVTMACGMTGAEIRYTTDASDPTSVSALCTSGLTVGSTTAFRARTFKAGMVGSPVASTTYTIVLAPWWPRKAFALRDAVAGTPYTNTVAGRAADPRPTDTMTFSKVSGPAWLNMAADGTLSGTPAVSDAGSDTFTLSVTDSTGGSDTATLAIIVWAAWPPPALPPVWVLY